LEFVLSLLVGVSLSATSGFRVFVPLLMLSIASLAGWLELTPTLSWIGTYPALAAFAVATIIELLAYFFPYVDNLLGAVATPVSVLAGTLITASVLVDISPMLAWVLAIVAGGGAALGGSAVSNLAHTGSTVTTGGTANPALSLVESVFSFILSLLAVLVPVLAFLLLALIIYLIVKLYRHMKKSQPHSLC